MLKVKKTKKNLSKGIRLVCGSKKCQFISKDKSGDDMQKFFLLGTPIELHRPIYSFCGPKTNLDERLDEADNPQPWSKLKIGLMKCA